jgi:hypothetical protein
MLKAPAKTPKSLPNAAPASRNLLTNDQAAAEIGLAPKTLSFWRCMGKGPAYVKLGGRVLYRRADLAAFIEANRYDPSAA